MADNLSDIKYCPLVKTTDAELKGFTNLDDGTKDGILPIIELTKSRRTKKNPEGDINIRLTSVEESFEGRKYILELTTEETLLNNQILDMYDDADGYENWCNFLSRDDLQNVIPSICVYAGSDLVQLSAQAKNLENSHGTIVFRASIIDKHYLDYIKTISDSLDDKSNLLIILDAEFLGLNKAESFVSEIRAADSLISENCDHQFKYIQLSSCFPTSVAQKGYCYSDDAGHFQNEDVAASTLLQDDLELGSRIIYGDYSSIHPRRYPTRGGTFIPRIDLPTSTFFDYRRYRRHDGGYVRAAKKIIKDTNFKSSGLWGEDQIQLAADGSPGGLGPVFWIAVRLNIHISRQYERICQ